MSNPRKPAGGTPAKRAAAKKAVQSRVLSGNTGDQKPAIALYEVMKAYETFEDIAEHLHQMIMMAIVKNPGMRRVLYLDVDEHRNEAGGFDHDSHELQKEFILGFLMPFLSEVHLPLIAATNPWPQRDDIPQHLQLIPGGLAAERDEHLRMHAEALDHPIYDSETGENVHPEGPRSTHRG
jgi:hypothetical protein